MLRRIMIIFATAGAAVALASALATAPAGAGAGSLEVYSGTSGGGSHTTVPSSTVGSHLNKCVDVSTLAGFAAAQSADNDTQYNLYLYGDTDCLDSPFYNLTSMTSWDRAISEPAAESAFVYQS